MSGQFDIGQINPLHYFFGIAVVLGFLFAFIAPDGDDTKNILVLITHWQLQSVLPMLFLIISHLLLHRIRLFNSRNPWLKLFCSGVIGVFLYSPIGLFLDVWFQGDLISSHAFILEWMSELSALLPPILIAWLAINAPWLIGFRISRISEPALIEVNNQGRNLHPNSGTLDSNPDVSEAEKSPILNLIPSNLGRKIIYLKAELHYLKVVTDKGSCLILYNLKDAINELPSDQGFQCHRSFWVAKSYIGELKKRGREGLLTMLNGEQIPVSRNRLALVTGMVGE